MIHINKDYKGFSDAQIQDFAKFVFTKFLKRRANIPDEPLLQSVLGAMGFSDSNDGYTYDVIPDGLGEFGMCITNPVPINIISSNELYLKRLISSEGM